jgi:hypothetical protein
VDLKFIKLFEDFKKEESGAGQDKLETWTQVRDCIQMKTPFVIITFKNKDSYTDAVDSYLKEKDYINQSAILSMNGKEISYPSVFFSLDSDRDFKTEVRGLYEKFKIIQVIVGSAGSEYSTLYSSDGTSSDFGNEIVSSISPDEFSTDDYFKLGSTYYKFVEFQGN